MTICRLCSWLSRFCAWPALFLIALLLSGAPLDAAETQSWQYLRDLSDKERRDIDPRTDTPRDAQLSYLPAEAYPFTAPYTAEEMGYRRMEFPHMPRWNCVQIEDFASLMPSGYLVNGKTIVLVHYEGPEGLQGHIRQKPGELYARWLSQDTAPPENMGNQMLMIHNRTDQQHPTKTNLFGYSPILRRVRRFPQPRRQDRFPNQPITYDDFLGRDAWEFNWRIIGADVLYETVRFPTTRQAITLLNPDGSFSEKAASDFKLMGDDYPAYTPDGGVKTYVLEATAKTDWLPDYYAPRILYWVEQRSFYPLRTEQYGPDGELVAIETRLVKLFNPALEEQGYHNLITVWWNAQLDFLAYAVHDGQKIRTWSEADLQAFFTPDFMRREWFPEPMKTQATAHTPKEFFLRPHLSPEKFPEERNVVLPPDLTARIQAQNAAGHVVFETSSAAGTE